MPNKNTPAFDARKYIREYVAEKLIYKKVHFVKGKPEDEEMVAWLDAQPEGIAPYIKRLIRQDMESRREPKEP